MLLPYRQTTLTNDTCTRVLTIQPSADKSSPVYLQVEEVDLAEPYKPFVAISHVWGSNPVYDRFAVCNGKRHRITGRVDSILHRLRTKMMEDEQCKHWNRIWIDTICIDQGHNPRARGEKSHQVSIMHKIFGNAQEVVIDLGRADEFSHLLPAAKADIKLLREKAFDDEYCKDILGFPSTAKVEAEEGKRVRKSLDACSKLLDKQWFCRIWAIQEYALARKASFLLGNVVVDGDLLTELSLLASDANLKGTSHLAMLFTRFRRGLALTKLPRLASIRIDDRIDDSQRLKLGESLGLGWHHDCTDERDVVYALRALTDYGDSALKIDYNEPVDQLAKRVGRKMIEIGHYEGVLAGCQGHLADSGSEEPSWGFRLRGPFKFLGEERHWILSGKPTEYAAGGPLSEPPLFFCEQGEHVGDLQGVVTIVGTVKTACECFPTIPQYRSNPNLPVEQLYAFNTERAIHTRAVMIEAWMRHILPQLNGNRPGKQLDRRSDELWKAVTHGHNAMEFAADDLSAQDRIDHWLMLVDLSVNGLETLGYRRHPRSTMAGDIRALDSKMRKRHALMAVLVQKPQSWIDELHRQFDMIGDPQTQGLARVKSKANALAQQAASENMSSNELLLRQMALNTYLVNEAFDVRKVRAPDQLKMIGRRICVLDDGRLASTPDAADTGDIIAIFRGISVPYALRPVGENRYKIVGMAYVDDIMRGEALNVETSWQKIFLT